ncbi:MAG: IclR family transcriptional regulator [Pseudonocardia sp.]
MAGGVGDPRRSVVSKVSAIIRTFGEGDSHSVTDIAAQCGLPLSTVHRLVAELAAWRLLERDDTGRYRPGRPLLLMGATHSCHPTAGTRARAAPVMEDLNRASGVAVRFGLLDGTRVAYLQKPILGVPVSDFSAAATVPLHATAMGKVLLAFSPPEFLELVVGHGLTAFTARTVTRPGELRRELRLIRANRIAVADGELRPGPAAVAAPVFGAGGSVVAALELEVEDLSRDVERLRAALTIAAGSLSRELGAMCAACAPAEGRSAEARIVVNLR